MINTYFKMKAPLLIGDADWGPIEGGTDDIEGIGTTEVVGRCCVGTDDGIMDGLGFGIMLGKGTGWRVGSCRGIDDGSVDGARIGNTLGIVVDRNVGPCEGAS